MIPRSVYRAALSASDAAAIASATHLHVPSHFLLPMGTVQTNAALPDANGTTPLHLTAK